MHAVLSIDGGGVRGLVSCRVLEALEQELRQQGKQEPLHRYFDLMVGTSAGGMVVAGLTSPKPGTGEPLFTAAEMATFFKSRTIDIFPRDWAQKIRTIFGPLGEEKYPAEGIEKILHEILGDTTLADAFSKVAITSYNIETREPHFFTNIPDENGSFLNFFMRDVARSTTAAPTYFEPARVTSITNNRIYSLIDGGVFMNDPCLAGVAYAVQMGLDVADTLFISIGSGFEIRPYKYYDMKNWRQLHWIAPSGGSPILSIMFSGQSFSTQQMLSKTLNRNGETRYIKIDDGLKPGNDDLDDASPQNLEELEIFSRVLLDKFKDEISYIARSLTPR